MTKPSDIDAKYPNPGNNNISINVSITNLVPRVNIKNFVLFSERGCCFAWGVNTLHPYSLNNTLNLLLPKLLGTFFDDLAYLHGALLSMTTYL